MNVTPGNNRNGPRDSIKILSLSAQVITGVFVTTAMETTSADKDLVVMKQLQKRNTQVGIYISINQSVNQSINQSNYLSIYLPIYLSIYLSISLSLYLSISLSFYLSISLSLSISLYLYLSLSLSISISISISICIYIYLFKRDINVGYQQVINGIPLVRSFLKLSKVGLGFYQMETVKI